VRDLRFPPGPCVSRWSQSHGRALLHQLRVTRLRESV